MSGSRLQGRQRSAGRRRGRYRPWLLSLTALLILGLVATVVIFRFLPHPTTIPSPPNFFASIDSMKLSRDTIHEQLSANNIEKAVSAMASVNANYITVDTHWDYPEYMERWITAIRAVDRHAWFRIHPNQWENNNGATGLMTPQMYKDSEERFIREHPSFFAAGDILDPCPEPEQGRYWEARYGKQWTYNAPNAATHEFNVFLRETTDVADRALHAANVNGVITTVRSTNSFFPAHRGLFEEETAQKFGRITFDSYPERLSQNPTEATRARVEELEAIEQIWHLPIIIGEMGYSNRVQVDDCTQQSVLKAEFAAIRSLPYVTGVNYWVGPGSDTAGGYTYIFARTVSGWLARPAAQELAVFFALKVHTQTAQKLLFVRNEGQCPDLTIPVHN